MTDTECNLIIIQATFHLFKCMCYDLGIAFDEAAEQIRKEWGFS